MHAIVGVILVLAVLLIAPAQHPPDRSRTRSSTRSSRAGRPLIGFTPTTLAIHPSGERVVRSRSGRGAHLPLRVRQCRRVVGPSADLRRMIRMRRYPSPEGVFLDAGSPPASAIPGGAGGFGPRCRRAGGGSGSPACGSGVSRSAVRGIAAGTIRTWSAAGVPCGERGRDRAAPGRRGDRAVGGAPLRRGWRAPQGARPRGTAASPSCIRGPGDRRGDELVASPDVPGTTCVVPVGGSAPTDASVRALSHPDAYPISFVTLRRLGNRGCARSSPRSEVPHRPSGDRLVPSARDAHGRRGRGPPCRVRPPPAAEPAPPEPAPEEPVPTQG
jgi:hypothetical protein